MDEEIFDVTGDVTAWQQVTASCSGALLTSLFVNPLDVVKVRMQKQVKQSLHNTVSPSNWKQTSNIKQRFCLPSDDLFKKIVLKRYVTPLDVVKVRLQAKQRPMIAGRCFIYCNGLMDHICTCEPLKLDPVSKSVKSQIWYARPGKFSGTLDAFIQISRTEGLSSLWSGLPPTLIMAVPATVIYFTSYDNSMRYLRRHYNYGVWMPLLAGGCARAACVSVISPLEMIRTKQQSEKLKYSQLLTAIRQSVAERGVKSMWTGLSPTLLRDVPFSCLYWAFYETVKQRLQNDLHSSTFLLSFLSGAVAGMLAATVTCPFDVIKTHTQIELGERRLAKDFNSRTTSWQLLSKLYAREGVRALFTGLTPRVIKVAPACAIMIGTYEYLKAFFRETNNTSR